MCFAVNGKIVIRACSRKWKKGSIIMKKTGRGPQGLYHGKEKTASCHVPKVKWENGHQGPYTKK